MRIAIDAGHGYNTGGKRSPEFVKTVTHKYAGHTVTVLRGECLREHVANAGVAYYLARELERCGVDVFKSAWSGIDGTKDLTDPAINIRQLAIKRAKCDLAISLHFNANDDNKFDGGKGCETFYHSVTSKVGDGKAFATVIQDQVANTFKSQTNRGVKNSSKFGMCNSVGMGVKAACLVELAFMTNQFECENYFANPHAWYKYAVSIAKGVCSYSGNKYVPYVPTVPITSNSSVEDIAWLQHGINCYGADLVPDGVYGPKTAQAVKDYYQQYFNAKSDGYKVWAKAINKLSK